MKKKVTKVLLGTGLVSLIGLMASCGGSQASESQDCEKQENNIEQVRKEYKNKCSDSIRTALGYDSLRAKYLEKGFDISLLERKIDSLEWGASLGGTIEKSVKSSGQKVISKFFADLRTLLGKYEISFRTCGEDESYFYFNTNTQNNYNDKDRVFKDELIFAGVVLYPENEPDEENGVQNGTVNGFEQLTDIVQEIVNESSYGQMRKDEIMQQVCSLFEKTKKQLIASRKSAEKQYADYYVTENDSDDIAVEEQGEGARGTGYGNFSWYERGSLLKETRIKVYDSKLPVAFFGDKDAEYKLISLGNDKWQVQKKTASGKIEKTAVFTDKGQIQEWFALGKIDAKDENSFWYTPGENMGVHVSYGESKIVKRAKKKWEKNKDVVRQINSLNQKIDKMYAQNKELDNRVQSILHYADSVSEVMASQRYESR